jgi:signal transduction histidine kinase/PAS domain-containing protein
MTWQTVLYFTSVLLTFAQTCFLAWFAWRRQRSLPGSPAFAGLALVTSLLALVEALSMISRNQLQAQFWFDLRFLFTSIIPVLFLIFALEFNRRGDLVSHPLLAAGFIIPFITQVMVWSNHLHGLWVRQEVGFYQAGPFWIADIARRVPGLWYMLHSFYSLGLILAGIVVIFVAARRDRPGLRIQTRLLYIGTLISLATVVLASFNPFPQVGFNLFTPGIGISILFYALALFRFQPREHLSIEEYASQENSLDPQDKRYLAIFVFIFILLVTVLSTIGYGSFQSYKDRYRLQVEDQVSAIAELKINTLVGWRAERQADADVFYNNPVFADLVEGFLKTPQDPRARSHLQSWLETLAGYNQYDRIFLLDLGGIERMSALKGSEPVGAYIHSQAALALASGRVTFVDFYRDIPGGPIHLALLVPVHANQDLTRPLAVLVFRIDPEKDLFPYINQWPTSSTTAETLLFRRDGTSVLFLNELRFAKDTALNLRISLDETQNLAVKASLGQQGVVEGIDYRGQEVVGFVGPVPGSDWYLEARIDLTEVYAPLQERFWQTVIFVGVMILTAGAGLGMVWRQQRVRYYRSQMEVGVSLRKSQEQIASISNNIQDGMIYQLVIQPDGSRKFTYLSESVKQLYGVSPTQATADANLIYARIHPEDIEALTRAEDESLTTGTVFKAEVRVLNPASKVRWSAFVSSPRRMENGSTCFDGIEFIITDRKQSEAALLENEQRVTRLLEQQVAINQLALALGESLHLEQVYHTVCEHIRQLVDLGCFIVSSYDEQTHLIRVEYAESDQVLDVSGFPPILLGDPGQGTQSWVVRTGQLRYIPDLQQAVKDYQSRENLEDDVPCHKEFGNDIEKLDKTCSVIYLPMKDKGVTVGVMQVQSYRLKAYSEEDIALLSGMANVVAVAIQNARLLHDLESELGQRLRAEQELKEYSVRLEERVEARTRDLHAAQDKLINQEKMALLGELAAGVGHDLRNPLAVINNAVYYLKLVQPDASMKVKDYLNLIEKETHTAELIITDLLDFARIKTINSEPLVVTDLVQRVLSRFPVPSSVQVVVDLPPGLPQVFADPGQIEQVMGNLTVNACQSMPLGGKMTVSARRLKRKVAIEVKDTGVGISPDNIKRLFEPLFTTRAKGIGLGLPVSQKLAIANGGRIKVKSQPGQGSTFTLYLQICS